MNDSLFMANERTELISWFNGYPMSRFWIRPGDDGICLVGYVTNTNTPRHALRLRMENRLLTDVGWHGWEGLPDPDNDPEPTQFRVFRWWPRLKGYGFRADLPFAALVEAGAGLPSLRIEIADADGRPICDPTQALFLPMTDVRSHLAAPRPPPHLITRVMCTDVAEEWVLTGYTNLRVFADIVWEALGERLESFGAVLEWGCGCGRLSRHLIAAGFSMVGIDIDKEAVDWCDAHLGGQARFVVCDLFPPTGFASERFGLAIGISVITHLDEASSLAWLAELARLLRPGGLLLLTTQALDTFSAVTDARIYRAIRDQGIFSVASTHLDDVIGPSRDYYRETFHSWDYIRARWTEWFDVVAIRRGGHIGYQDLVVLRRRTGGGADSNG